MQARGGHVGEEGGTQARVGRLWWRERGRGELALSLRARRETRRHPGLLHVLDFALCFFCYRFLHPMHM